MVAMKNRFIMDGRTLSSDRVRSFGYLGSVQAEYASDFNVLLLLVPVSFVLSRSSIESDTLIFICTL